MHIFTLNKKYKTSHKDQNTRIMKFSTKLSDKDTIMNALNENNCFRLFEQVLSIPIRPSIA